MTSTKAGSAICDCDNPDDCTHKIDIKLGDKTISYQQFLFPYQLHYVVDKPKEGEIPQVPITLTSISKGCISHNSRCPIGNLSNEKSQPIAQFSPNKPYTGKLSYSKKTDSFSVLDNSPIVLLRRFLEKDFYSQLESENYYIRVDECAGKPLVDKTIDLPGIIRRTTLGNKTILGTNIHLYLNERQAFNVAIGAAEEIEKYTDEQRRQQQKETNRKKGMRYKGSQGWRRNTKPYEVRNSLTIEGEITAEKGAETRSWSKELEFEFKKGKKKLGPIDTAIESIGKLNNILAFGHDQDKFRVINLDLIYPLINISGGYELSHSDNYKLFCKFNADITATPLIGLELRADVIQIFAAYFKVDTLVTKIREKGEEFEQEVKQGKNGAFYGAQLDLILSGDLNVMFGWESDDKGDWSFKKDAVLETGFGIRAETNIRGGVRYYAINGYFDASAQIAAKVNVALASTEKSMELILYHDGIQASASVKYGIRMGDKKSKDNEDVLNEEQNKNTEGVKERDWVFQKPLSKEESPYRISLG
ncbi:hypothetical protein [Xenorhabdus kozodoii]|uniref:Uncharacterized protein n=1 Tax=Xenorhabdus kozodoii TaxID=351676 RepID=A0A2D0LEM4_9GAMM|nr:hypothetical protein [Xenorhabdus kozodoii]PHM74055.1 hypothetical protein Xkoz_01264 [Xenorhabdus kozodoii]